MDIAIKREKEKQERKKALEYEYKRLLDNSVEKERIKYEKKKQRRWNRIERDFDKKTRKLVLLEQNKGKLKTETNEKKKEKIKERIEKVKSRDVKRKPNYKQLAFKYFQLYIRLKYANKEGMVWLIYERKRVHYKNCNAGHYFGKSKNAHMVFLEDNCMPISSDTNRQQGEYEGTFRANALIENIGIVRYIELKQIAGDTIAKNKLRDMNYYRGQYELWKGKCEVIAKEKGFTL